jgi:hypothetical protein
MMAGPWNDVTPPTDLWASFIAATPGETVQVYLFYAGRIRL